MRILVDTFTALFPLYVYIGIGIILRKTGLLIENDNKRINKLIFTVFLPCSLFESAYRIEPGSLTNGRVIAFVLIVYLVLFGFLFLSVPLFVKNDRPAAASIIQASYRSNFVILGMTYARLLYDSSEIATVSILTAVIIPLYNILAVITFEVMRGGRIRPGRILVRILKNPLIIAVVLGVILKFLNFDIPALIMKPIGVLSDIASPLALIIIGATLTLEGFQRNIKRVLWVTALRLLIIPLILMPVSILMGFRDVVLVALLVAFGGPCAVSSVPMAYELGGDGELSGQLTATTTLLSIFSLFFFIFALRYLGYC